MDPEGIVCNRKNSPYRVTEKPSPHCLSALARKIRDDCVLENLVAV
jgi:hypothetical protein